MKLERRRQYIPISVDSREKYEIEFPKVLPWYGGADGVRLLQVKPKRRQMPAGDYAMHMQERKCLIERKGGVDELAKNLVGPDWDRQRRAFARLRDATEHPILLVDGGLPDLVRYKLASPVDTRYGGVPDIRVVIDRLMASCVEFGMQLWLTGGTKSPQYRRHLGDLVVRLLLAYCWGPEKISLDSDNEQCTLEHRIGDKT